MPFASVAVNPIENEVASLPGVTVNTLSDCVTVVPLNCEGGAETAAVLDQPNLESATGPEKTVGAADKLLES